MVAILRIDDQVSTIANSKHYPRSEEADLWLTDPEPSLEPASVIISSIAGILGPRQK